MAPVHSYGDWDTRKTDQETLEEPYRRYYFIAEGANTERFYFEKLIDERKKLGFLDSVDIKFLEKTEQDRDISYPAHLIKFAEKLKKNKEIIFDVNRDKMVIIFDADIYENKVNHYQELLQNKKSSSIYAITNPSFELFLLLHLEKSWERVIKPNEKRILNNLKENGKRPVYRLLLDETGMNSKRNCDIGKLALNIDTAIEQEKKINQDIQKCAGSLTSNIGKIISEIRRRKENM